MNECKCVGLCECDKASDIYKQYAADYFVPIVKKAAASIEDLNEEDDLLLWTEVEDYNELECTDKDDLVDEGPFKTPQEIEQRKSELKGTTYANNDFTIANCHIVQVEVAFKHMAMNDIPGIVTEATDGNFEILELRDHFVEFLAHYEPEYYSEDDVLNYLIDVFGHEVYSIVSISYL